MKFNYIHLWWLVLSSSPLSHAAYIQSQGCGLNGTNFQLQPLVVDAGIDRANQKLKFLVNSRVSGRFNSSSSLPLITDINPLTNIYTTLHVEIDFMGKTILSENKRFCQMIAVSRPSVTSSSSSLSSSSSTSASKTTTLPVVLQTNNAGSSQQAKRAGNSTGPSNSEFGPGGRFIVPSLSSSNSTIEDVFNNSTGTLIQCPLYQNDSIMLYYEADISSHFHRLGSYTVRFSVVSNNLNATVIGCNMVYVTPVLPESVSNSLIFFVVALLVTAVLVNSFTIVGSSYQESSNPFLVMASTICNEDLLRQMDASVPRIILYMQFALFMSGLDLQYPGFYQPLIAKLKWCALLGYAIVSDKSRDMLFRAVKDVNSSDNIYRTFNAGGLTALTRFASSTSVSGAWENFMLCFLVWIGCQVLVQQVFLGLKLTLDKLVKIINWNNKKTLLNDDFHFDYSKNVYLILGQVLYSFLLLFAFPFLIFTSSLFSAATQLNGKDELDQSSGALRQDAFDFMTTCDDIFGIPDTHNSTFGPPPPGNGTHPKTFARLPNVPAVNLAFGSILFCLWLSLVGYFIFRYIISFQRFSFVTNKNVSKLYTSLKNILLWGVFYHQYNPDKVHFVVVDYANILIKSLIVGCLQSYGLVQVILLIILEFSNMALLFLYRPHFIKVGWVSSIWILPLAKFLVTALSIAYIRELGISETTRTYVSFAQLSIHALVAVLFVFQLIYGFISTLMSILKDVRLKREQKCAPTQEAGSLDDLINGQFEYKPMIHQSSKPKPRNTSSHELNPENIFSDDTELDDFDEDFYFRAKSQRQLEKMHREQIAARAQGREISDYPDQDRNSDTSSVKAEATTSPKTFSNEIQLPGGFESISDFSQQQIYSNLRKNRTDYRVREGDNIYKKFLLDDSMDPEVKALWRARKIKADEAPSVVTSETKCPKGFMGKLYKYNKFPKVSQFIRPPPTQVGFHVDRPRKLVVRTVDELKQRDISLDHSLPKNPF